MNSVDTLPEILGTTDIARLCGVTTQTVQSWIDREILVAHRTPGGHRRVRREEFQKFLEKFPFPSKNKKVSILVADDDGEHRRTITEMFSAERDCHIKFCGSGVEGLLHLGTWQPSIMILDIFHPSWNGLNFLPHVKSMPELKDTRFIIATGKKNGSKTESSAAGADGFLVKPVEPGLLKTIIFPD